VTLDAGETRTLSFTVSNAGGQTLNWSVADAPKWAVVSERGGSLGFREKRTVSVTISSAGLAPGETRGEISFGAPGAGRSPLAVAVVVRVTASSGPRRREALRRPDRAARTAIPDEPPPGRKPARPPVRRPAEPPAHRPSGLALRLGYEPPSSGAEEKAYAGLVLGLAHWRSLSSVEFELGLDLGTRVVVGDSASLPLAARADAVFPLGRGYLLAGGAGAVEFVTDNVTGDKYTNGALGLDLGAGFRTSGSKLDVRLTYRVIFAENIRGRAGLSAGYRF
jgi:hypothetical protein